MADTALPVAPVWVRFAVRVIGWLPAGRFRTADWLGRHACGPFWMRLPAEVGGAWFRCDLSDSLARHLCFTGRYEPQETLLVRALLGPGMTFVDVGANWGYFSLLAAHLVGGCGRVVSLEPDPRLFPILEANIRRNGLSQIRAVQAAVADTPGERTLLGYPEEGGNRGVSRLSRGDESGPVLFTVSARTLDGIFDDFALGTIDLLKMDIEGAEGLAIGGLRRSLATHRVRRLLLELHPERIAEYGQSVAEVLDELRATGYQAWSIDHTPSTTRRLSYSRQPTLDGLLRVFDVGVPLDGWPHLLWTLPDEPPGAPRATSDHLRCSASSR